jgi:DNA-binding CsgD family transcriptional regulator
LDGRIAVVLEPARAADALPVTLLAHGLTSREAQVAQLVVRGHSTRQIVEQLHISRHTVQDHLKAVFDKTGVRSRRDLVAFLLGGPR